MRVGIGVLVAAATLAAPLQCAAAFPEVPGWKPVGEVATYGPDQLWEYIDGAADLFLGYGFRLLEARELESGPLRVMVNIYEMGSGLDAYGVLTTEGGGGTLLPVGAGAVLSPPYQFLVAKDRFYVKVETTGGEVPAGTGEALVGAIARALPGVDGPPAAVKLLPADAVRPGAAGFTRSGFLGLAELPACVHAGLAGGAEGAQVFVVVPPADGNADSVWKALAARWSAVEHAGRPILSRSVPYRGLVGVIRGERGVFGVAGLESRDELVRRLEALAR